MNYYIDTEFLEGTQKEKFPINLFRKNTPPTIDLISIGIVAEDEREYYAISKDFNLEEAWNRFDLKDDYDVNGDLVKNIKKVYWIRENVLKPIYDELLQNRNVYEKMHHWSLSEPFSLKSMKYLLSHFGKTNKQIAKEVQKFCEPSRIFEIERPITLKFSEIQNPKFYAYYADYDWVSFCWLFGKMIDLPSGFPMYCNDLKQIFEQKQDWLRIPTRPEHIDLKLHSYYPKQENEHNALADARWNKKLHEFLNKL